MCQTIRGGTPKEVTRRPGLHKVFRHFQEGKFYVLLNNDLEPPRQAAAVLGELRGSAQEFAREIPPNIIIQGGMVDGIHVDPLTYVVTHLADRFAVLGEESRLAAMTELMTFSRRQGETIDQLLSRFDLVRQRAQDPRGLRPHARRVLVALAACQRG